MNRFMIILASAIVLAACAEDGVNGTNGSNGTNGADGGNGNDGSVALVSITDLPPGVACAAGGKRIDSGVDANDNGILDNTEIQDSTDICNGDVELTPGSIALEFLGRYSSGSFLTSSAEIVAFHPLTQTLFVVNAQAGAVDVLDAGNPATPYYLNTLDVSDIAVGATINSVAVSGNLVAFAIQAPVKTDAGYVAIYNARTLARLAVMGVGAQPDMLTFSPNGRYILVANEAEPSADYSVDPEGSVSIIDITTGNVQTAGFSAFNGQEATLRAEGVRIYSPGANAAKDFEPEYITVSADSSTAWVTLQENNALAKINIATATVTAILPLGYKDHGLADNGFGSSNALDLRDSPAGINIGLAPGIYGMYQPDAIASYEVEGQQYLVMANEGDSRAWGEGVSAYLGTGGAVGDPSKGFIEEFRVTHLSNPAGWSGRRNNDLPPQLDLMAAGGLLDPAVFGWCGATAGNPGNCRSTILGRLTVTWTMGYKTNPDGSPTMYDSTGVENVAGNRLMYDKLYALGGRSFSIRNASTAALVWDSGDRFEQYIGTNAGCKLGAARNINCATYFNSNHEAGSSLDNRSDNKGPEPEGLAIGRIGDKTFAFIGLERMGGIMVYDISTPAAPVFIDYLNSREDWTTANPGTVLATAGDLGPEGLTFIPASNSPTGEALLAVGYEVSGTTALYRVEAMYGP